MTWLCKHCGKPIRDDIGYHMLTKHPFIFFRNCWSKIRTGIAHGLFLQTPLYVTTPVLIYSPTCPCCRGLAVLVRKLCKGKLEIFPDWEAEMFGFSIRGKSWWGNRALPYIVLTILKGVSSW